MHNGVAMGMTYVGLVSDLESFYYCNPQANKTFGTFRPRVILILKKYHSKNLQHFCLFNWQIRKTIKNKLQIFINFFFFRIG